VTCDYKQWLLGKCVEEGMKDTNRKSQNDVHQLFLKTTCRNPKGDAVENIQQSNCSMPSVVLASHSTQNIPLVCTNPSNQGKLEAIAYPLEEKQAAEKQRAALRQESRQKELSLSKEVTLQHTSAAPVHGTESQASNIMKHPFYSFKCLEPINLLFMQHVKPSPPDSSTHPTTHPGVTGQNKNMEASSRVISGSLSSLPPSSRFGDPRMNSAVIAKIKNPNLTYLEALTVGGFKFTGTIKWLSGKTDKQILDEDNISLSQRKNQLARRLRVLKKSAMA